MKTIDGLKYMMFVGFMLLLGSGCKLPKPVNIQSDLNVPQSFDGKSDSLSMASFHWKVWFDDTFLLRLIDTALRNNRELAIMNQEILMSRSEIMSKRGAYLPFVKANIRSRSDKEGRYTRFGALDENLEIESGEFVPSPYNQHQFGFEASWELDVWKKLRNAKASAYEKYLASIEGRNFVKTRLIAELAESYYEWKALEEMLAIVDQSIRIQTDVLNIMKQEKESAKVSQLAVNRFIAQRLNTQNLQYRIRQEIQVEKSKILFLTGKFEMTEGVGYVNFYETDPGSYRIGLPSDLLMNRPDIKNAELQLKAANLDVKVARAEFLPSFSIQAGIGFQAFKPKYLINPESLIYGLLGEIMAPLLNRQAIQGEYQKAGARQVQAMFEYEQTVIKAYTEVLNELTRLENLNRSFQTKKEEVEILNQSVSIAGMLYNVARANYGEVLLTQREALAARMELVEISLEQKKAGIYLYRALGGGWR